jgi:cholesterol transport system auxiliary component
MKYASKTISRTISDRDGPETGHQDRRQLLRAALILPLAGALAGALAGCESVVPGRGPMPDLYRLTPKSTFAPDLPTVEWQLLLEPPLTNASIDTTRIGLQRSSTSVEYYARASWSDRAPQMIQTLMVESFENTGRIIAVGRDSVALRADYILKTDLREFQAKYMGGPNPRVHVAMIARLIKMPRRAIIGTKKFETMIEAQTDNMETIIAAFDQALGKVLKRLVEWTLITGQEAWKRP